MNRTQMLKRAEQWKVEKIGQMKARIQISEALLRAERTDLAHLRKLEGRALLGQFSCESPAEVATVMRERDEFLEAIHDIFEAGMWVGR